MLKGKKIILAISGSIAAYKSAILCRLLIKSGAIVKVVMTENAKDFIPALTLSTLSKNPVISSVSSEEGWNNHVELGLWADAMLIAPVTANTLAKIANGFCDNMLTAVYLSAKCPVFFAPAMDLDMWIHPLTQNNLKKLISFGNIFIDVEDGELASGLVGKGRMAEPEKIIEILEKHFAKKQDLKGKKVLITSGPTVEPIDPVRFISNHSTGKMGMALAEELAERGAEITFISGPVQTYPSNSNIKILKVKTAEEMYQAALSNFTNANVIILTAAVADYTVENYSDEKIKKKNEDGIVLELKKTKDIAAELGKIKSQNQLMVGFALETQNFIENANKKIHNKNLDMIVLNSLRDHGAGFGHDTNKITIIDKSGYLEAFELKTKKEVSVDIVDKICKLLSE